MRRFEFPDGSLYDVTEAAVRTGGRRSELEITLPPSPTSAPPAHVHPAQEERYEVVDGALEVLVGRAWQRLNAGEAVAIPPGTVHTFRNRSGQNVSFRCVHEPAGDFERYLERLYWLNAMNRIRGSRDLTSALYASLLYDTHRGSHVLARPAARLRTRALAGLARLLRLRVDR